MTFGIHTPTQRDALRHMCRGALFCRLSIVKNPNGKRVTLECLRL